MSRKAIIWTVVIILAIAGIIYGIIMLLANNLMVGVDQSSVAIEDPMASGDLSNGELKGSVNLVVTNPTPFGFNISSIYATVTDPSGNVLATIQEPFAGHIGGNGATVIPLYFTAEVETAAVSLLTQLIGKQVGGSISGKLYLLGGLLPISFSESLSFKI